MKETPLITFENYLDPATVLAGAVIAYADPNARNISATCWASSKPLCTDAYDWIAREAGSQGQLHHAFSEVTNHDDRPGAYRRLREAIRGSGILSRPDAMRLAQRIASDVRLLYFVSESRAPGYPPSVREKDVEGSVDIVIPFRSREPSDGRLRNLSACLSALEKQSARGEQYRVIVVESDDFRRHQEWIEPRVDAYGFIRDDGLFNKAAVVNVGVSEFATGPIICVLDADIVVDSDFVVRCLSSMASSAHAVLPFQDAFCLDAESSTLVATDSAISRFSGYLLRRPPGGCVWVSTESFHTVDGFDERYVGWGGEDRDFINRLSHHGEVLRHPGLLLHLDHGRPVMRSNRQEIHTTARREKATS